MNLLKTLVTWLLSIPARRAQRKAEQAVWEKEQAESRTRILAEREEEKRKIERAQRLLTGTDWRDPAGKKEFVDEVYDGGLPCEFWYALGQQEMTPEEFTTLKQFFWGEHGPRGGECELHRSYNRGTGMALRISRPRQFAAEITVGGVRCPLYQTGHVGLGGSSQGGPAASFLRLYEEPATV